MSTDHLAKVDATLLALSAARERAEWSARELRREGADERLVTALEQADDQLNAAFAELQRAAFFPAASAQLRLASG
jgi:hypothetical protein